MEGIFCGKCAVVTGTDAAGRSAALALAREGAAVYLCGPQPAELESLAEAEGLDIHTGRLELTDDRALSGYISSAGRAQGAIHVLVCGGRGTPVRTPVAETAPEAWSGALDAALRTRWKAVTAALPYLERAGAGAVVLLTSAALLHPAPGDGVDAVCAAGVESMTKTLASELASRHIRVNTVALDGDGAAAGGPVVFLASDRASYCTGALLEAGTMRREVGV